MILDAPVVLAPMAGITNSAFRTLCREQGAGLFVSEMVTARALIERHPETLRLITPGKGETPRSVQLYGVDPTVIGMAVKMLCEENLADHIDMNFGCPVPKVTRKGGGAALPYKRKIFSAIVESAVKNAKPYGVPITVKMRVGIDSDHETYLEAAKNAADAGVAWVALHARTAQQMYDGQADWSKIAELVEHLKPTGVPVLGNGDIWSGADGRRMMEEGKSEPTLFEVRDVMRRHGQLLMEFFEAEGRAMRDLRKHMAWYLKGFTVPREIRSGLGMVASYGELEWLTSQLEDQPYPTAVSEAPRGRRSHGRAPSLPDGWLNDPDEYATITIDDSVSGG